MNKDYRIRQYQPGDEKEIESLLQNVFGGWPHLDLSSSPLEYWRWKFNDNPLGITFISLAVQGSKVIGCIHGIPRKIKILDQVLLCDTGVDLAVQEDFRRRGIHSKMDELITRLEKESGIEFVYWITGNPIIIERDSRHYFRFPHTVINLVRIKDIDKQLQAISIDNGWLMKLSFHAAKLINDIMNVLGRNKPSNRDVNISEIDSFDDRIDRFWGEVSNHYDFIVERRRDYLNWRYCDPRGGGFTVKQAEENGQIVGYNVLRINRYRPDYPVGFIVDLLVLPNRLDVAHALTADAVRYFDSNDINIVNFQVVRGHRYENVLKMHGFLDSRINVYMGCKTFGKGERVSKLKKSRASKIFVSWGDHDVLPIAMPRY